MGSQSRRNPSSGNFETPTWESRNKKSFGCGPVEKCGVYYKREGGGFPQVQVMVSFVSSNCMWLILAPKVLQLCTNHFVLILCRSVWVSEACQFFLIPSRSSNTPLYPSKMLQARACLDYLLFRYLSIWIHIWVPKGVGSASEGHN
jgi:hypothetical protein